MPAVAKYTRDAGNFRDMGTGPQFFSNKVLTIFQPGEGTNYGNHKGQGCLKEKNGDATVVIGGKIIIEKPRGWRFLWNRN